MSVAGSCRRAIASLVAASGLVLFSACSSDGGSGSTTDPGDGGNKPTPTIAVSLGASSLEVTQGASANVTVNVTRGGGYTGDVSVSVEGLPTGVTAPSATITSSQSSGTLAFTAATAAAAGNSSLTIRATGTGVTAVTASLALTVKAATTTNPGSFSLSASPTSVSLAQGASGSVTVNVARAGSFSGAVALTVTGAPTGLTATLGASSVTGASTTLSLTAASTLAAGSQTLTVKGTGSGVTDQTITIPVTITAATSNPSTGNVKWTFCGSSGIPVWVASQDGTAAWSRVTAAADGSYSFNVAGAKGAIAYVVPFGTGYDLEVFYGTQQDLITRGTELCNGASGAGKTITSSIVGASGTDIAVATLGTQAATIDLSQSANISFAGVNNGTVDLIASRSTLTLSGFTPVMTLGKIIIRRGLNPTSSIPAIDFGAAEAFDGVQKNVTINNLGSEIALVTAAYRTANASLGAYLIDVGGASGSTRTWKGIPSAQQQAGDFHVMSISALPSLTQTNQTRNAVMIFKDAADKTVTLGPALTAPTISALTAAGYGRARAAITVQAEYGRYYDFDVQQTGSVVRRTQVQQTADYQTGSTVTLDIPDLSAVAGFDATWGLKTGTSATYTVTASGWSASTGIVGPPFVEGATYVTGTRQGSITP